MLNAQPNRLNKTIRALRAHLHSSETGSGVFTITLTCAPKTDLLSYMFITDSKRKAESLIQILYPHEQKHRCEATVYAEGHIIDAAVSLLEVASTINEDVKVDKIIMDWLSGEYPCHRCRS